MKHTITMQLDFEYDCEQITAEFDYMVEENLQDIIEYRFEQKYHKQYNVLDWYLEPGAKELIKEITSQWLTNTLDTFSLYTQDQNFIAWLTQRYEDAAIKACKKDWDDYYFAGSAEDSYDDSWENENEF